ncbi:MAG: glycosyltransferase family 4 protein [Myxococcota bacterium]|nr:glycosyltransferase family 4 protein [Myxococcota bacterium]
MHIRFLAYFYTPCIGGCETVLQHQAEELVRRGHQVDVHVTPYTIQDLGQRVDSGTEVIGGVRVHRHPSFGLPFTNPFEKDAVTPGFVRAALASADLVVCVGFPSLHLEALSMARRLSGAALVVQNYITAEVLREVLNPSGTAHRHRVRTAYWQGRVRSTLRQADLVIADSPGAARALGEWLGTESVHCHIGMAVDPREFEDVTPQAIRSAREALGLGRSKVILAPSRIAHQKGTDLLVQAAAPLLRDASDDWRIAVVGPVNEPSFLARVEQLAAPLGERVRIGRLERPELLALMSDSQMVVLPSRGETVGGVVFEGMYAGALAIVSDGVEAARDDYLNDGVNGLLVPAGSVEGLQAALPSGMGGSLESLREEGRRMVEQRFTWGRSVDRLVELYNIALEGSARG